MTEEKSGSGVDREGSTASSKATASGGVMCGRDGCVHITAREAEAILESVEKQTAERIARLPDERAAIGALFDGWVRLKEMGWREAMYAPRGQPLEMIEVGSTGIHCGYRDDIGFWIQDEDTWPSSPCLWRWPFAIRESRTLDTSTTTDGATQ